VLLGKYTFSYAINGFDSSSFEYFHGEVNGTVSVISEKLAAASCDFLESQTRKTFN